MKHSSQITLTLEGCVALSFAADLHGVGLCVCVYINPGPIRQDYSPEKDVNYAEYRIFRRSGGLHYKAKVCRQGRSAIGTQSPSLRLPSFNVFSKVIAEIIFYCKSALDHLYNSFALLVFAVVPSLYVCHQRQKPSNKEFAVEIM